jgi:hypothetical protein
MNVRRGGPRCGNDRASGSECATLRDAYAPSARAKRTIRRPLPACVPRCYREHRCSRAAPRANYLRKTRTTAKHCGNAVLRSFVALCADALPSTPLRGICTFVDTCHERVGEGLKHAGALRWCRPTIRYIAWLRVRFPGVPAAMHHPALRGRYKCDNVDIVSGRRSHRSARGAAAMRRFVFVEHPQDRNHALKFHDGVLSEHLCGASFGQAR